MWNQLKPLFATTLSRSSSAPRDVSGDHVLNKRESRSSRGASPYLSLSLVSYGAWPGDQGRFYSREAEPRVPASRRDAAAEKRGEREVRAGGKSDLRDGETNERGGR